MRKPLIKRLLIVWTVLSLACSLTACRESEEEGDKKPVIYLYPESTTDVTVKLDYAGEITCTYPEYKDGWKVTASPDGPLKDATGRPTTISIGKGRIMWSMISRRASVWSEVIRQLS